MDLSKMICLICDLGLKDCTCADIDERMFNFNASVETLKKQKVSRMEERLFRLRAIYMFGYEWKIDEPLPLAPWTGYRDKVFAVVEERPVEVPTNE